MKRQPQTPHVVHCPSWPSALWWNFARSIVWLAQTLLWHHRWWAAHNIPRTGPVLLVSNHQSYLDLTVLGAGISERQFYQMAESGLFVNRFFGGLISSLNAFPVDQGKGDIKALRKAIDLLRQGRMLLVFPEGHRTDTGMVDPFLPGIMLLVRRARPKVVPVAVEGAFDIWPRRRPWPRIGLPTATEYGEPIDPDELLAMSDEEAVELLRRRVDDMRLQLRARLRRRTRGRFPPPGPGDHPSPPIDADQRSA